MFFGEGGIVRARGPQSPVHRALRARLRGQPFPVVVTDPEGDDPEICPAASIYSAARLEVERLAPGPIRFARPAARPSLVELIAHLRRGSEVWLEDAHGVPRLLEPHQVTKALDQDRRPEPAVWKSPGTWDRFDIVTQELLPALAWATELHLPPVKD